MDADCVVAPRFQTDGLTDVRFIDIECRRHAAGLGKDKRAVERCDNRAKAEGLRTR